MAAVQPPPLTIIPTPALAPNTNTTVRIRCARHDTWRRWRRNIGNSPKTSMEKRVKEKTCVVDVRRDASTVDAMSAALVDKDAGNLVLC